MHIHSEGFLGSVVQKLHNNDSSSKIYMLIYSLRHF